MQDLNLTMISKTNNFTSLEVLRGH